MPSLRIKQVVFVSGERFPMLLDECGVPDFWSTLYVSQKLRVNHTQASINETLGSLRLLYSWQKTQGRDLIDEIRREQFPQLTAVESIKEYCGIRRDALQAESNRKAKVVSLDTFAKARSPLSRVGSDLQKKRMYDIAGFLSFVAQTILRDRYRISDLLGEIEGMRKLFKAHYPKSSNRAQAGRMQHAEEGTFSAFMSVIHPNNAANPFKNYETQLRNYLLIQLLYWTGARSGELLSLTVDDLDYGDSPKVEIVRRHDDPSDTREHQPVTKTLERSVEIPGSLRNDIDYYIMRVRPIYSKSKTHPYIFVSQKGETIGQPMSDSNFYLRIIGSAKSVYPVLFKLIRRHGFRHFFNERLSEKIDEHNVKINEMIKKAEEQGLLQEVARLKQDLISEAKELDIRAYLMGHKNKASGLAYIKRHIEKTANKIHKELMQEMSAITKAERGDR